MVLYVVALGFGGVLQGLSLLDPAQSFQASVEAARPWMHARSVAAVLISVGHLAFVWHVILLYRLSRSHDKVLEPAFYYIRPILVKEE
jgi:cytochrome c oxidase cbb3-type subunit 1